MSPTTLGRVVAMLRFFGSVSNLPLLTIDYYYNYSHDKMMKGKIETGQGYGMGIGRCNELCPMATGLRLITLFSLSYRLRTVRCCGW